MLVHTDAFTHRRYYIQTLYTHALLHTDIFTHMLLYSQTLAQPVKIAIFLFF